MAGAGALALAGRHWLVREAAAADSPLSGLPRMALVIGNSRYRDTPLRNPANDANAIAAQLKEFKFDVSLQVDARRQEMVEAIGAYGASLAKSKAIGLFYYAGHGAQLAWRNYLIPVDAALNTAEELLAQAIDMNALLDDLIRARNPMNVIILDACRDNPFGSQMVLAQRGLSQLDAPVGTLLAYATAPGNVAADGTGENGLYTGFLLKEMQARDAKIEDVFKRVRLNVRRLSKGQQIPWESTSLEQDFYFYPAAAARKLSPEEQEKQFEEELEIWQRIRATTDPAPLEDYLRRFPSGKFSELAQFRLDRLMAKQGAKPVDPRSVERPALQPYGFVRVDASEPVRVAVPSANPYTKGTALADVDYQIGDSYTYVRQDAFSRVEEARFEERVTEVTDLDVTFNRGHRVTDLLGNDVIARGGAKFSPSQIFVYEYRLGKKWATRFHVIRSEEGRGGGGRKGKRQREREDDIEIEFRVVGRESVTVPAGTFDAFRVEGTGYAVKSAIVQNYNYWIAPDLVRRVLAFERIFYASASRHASAKRAERFELVAYSERRVGKAAA
jgi:hypothetical protein